MLPTKKSIKLFVLLFLSAYPFPHIIQTNGGLQDTEQNMFMYRMKSYIIRPDVNCNWTYHSSFLQAEIFYFL